ncbi:MAG: translation initiation factor IF-1 [Candidatus Roizmanbacteria bacterium]|nr:translation initiation factor IF-1 [Candidatus Roizmanbacteria bacterium]
MTNTDFVVLEGEIVENLPNTQFRVRVDSTAAVLAGNILLCYLKGRMRKNYIKVMPGDRVRIEVSKYDTQRGRIIFRL